MSLHNQDLQHNKEDILIAEQHNRKNGDCKRHAISLQNILISLISFGIVVALFYLGLQLHINNYMHDIKNYIMPSSNKLSSNYNESNSESLSNINTNKHRYLANNHTVSQEYQYYVAIDLLNSGNASKAEKILNKILDENPDFFPAKRTLSVLSSDI